MGTPALTSVLFSQRVTGGSQDTPSPPLIFIADTLHVPPLPRKIALLQLQVITMGEELESLFCQVQEM